MSTPVEIVSMDTSSVGTLTVNTDIYLTYTRTVKRLDRIIAQLSNCPPIMQSILHDLGEEMLRLGAGLTEIEYHFGLINQVLGDEKK